ncbi:Ubiquitin-like protein 7 [Nymphon striatum]|nr:Ubiquitin-like protein 7 [Nymphon striatum]
MAKVYVTNCVKSAENSKIEVTDIDFHSLVCNLKERVSTEIDCPTNQFEIIYAGQCLKNNQNLNFYGIKNGSTLYALKSPFNQTISQPTNPLVDEAAISQSIHALRTAIRNPSFRSKIYNLKKNEVLNNIISETPGLAQDHIAINKDFFSVAATKPPGRGRLYGGLHMYVNPKLNAKKTLKSKAWFTHHLRSLRSNCLHLRHLSTLDPSFTRYCVARTAYHKGIRYAKAAYLHKKSEMLIINAKELGIKALHRDIKITPSSSISIHSLFDHCKNLFISDNPLPSEFTQIPSCERENHPLLYPYSLQEIKAVLLRVKSKAYFLQDPELLMQLTDKSTMTHILKSHPCLLVAIGHVTAAVHDHTAPSYTSGFSYSLNGLSDEDDDGGENDVSRLLVAPRNESVGSITSAQLASALAAVTATSSSDSGQSSSSSGGTSGQSSSSGTSSQQIITTNMFNDAMHQALSGVTPARNPATNTQAQLEQLRAMGITDDAVSLHALELTGGNVQAALELIFGDFPGVEPTDTS